MTLIAGCANASARVGQPSACCCAQTDGAVSSAVVPEGEPQSERRRLDPWTRRPWDRGVDVPIEVRLAGLRCLSRQPLPGAVDDESFNGGHSFFVPERQRERVAID